MKKQFSGILVFILLSAIGVSAQWFPEEGWRETVEIGPGWSEQSEHLLDYSDTLIETHRGPLAIQFHERAGLSHEQIVSKFADSLPDRAEFMSYIETANDDQGNTVDTLYVSGSVDGRDFYGRIFVKAEGRDVLIVMYVPVQLRDEYWSDIRDILYS